MLGTPNFGSFSPIQAFRGTHSVAAKVAFLDIVHSPEDLARIYGGFPGLCQMIPSPDKVSGDFFQLSSWPSGGLRPSQAILTQALKVQRQLPAEYGDLVVVAGVDQDTVVDAKVQDGEFVYTNSTAGDGTVPLACALLPGAQKTYYVVEAHGSLPNNGTVARAVDSILATGETNLLPTRYEPRRSGPTRHARESEIKVQQPFSGDPGRLLSAREKRHLLEEVAAPDARDTTEAAIGPSTSIVAAAVSPAMADADAVVADSIVIGRRRQHRLDVTLVHGSITDIEADAYVLGMFKLVPPGGAASAVDALLEGAIGQMVARRMFNANVGEISMLPTGKHPVRAEVIAFAGLGSFDTFNEEVLEIVGENLVRTFINTRIDEFATVPIGGASNAFTPEALRRMLKGFLRGLLDADRDHYFRGITICETDRDRFLALQREFYRLCGTTLFDGVEVTLREVELPPPVQPAAARAGAPAAAAAQDVYLLVRQESDKGAEIVYGCSVLTAGSKATIYKDRQVVKKDVLDQELARLERLAFSDVPKFGGSLADLVLPKSTVQILERHLQRPMVVVHDGPSSRIPWETLHIKGKSPALGAGLTHRYEAEDLSIAKWLAERQDDATLDVLLVVNPTEDLDGAEEEGKRVRKLFEGLKPSVAIRELHGKEARKSEIAKCLKSDKFDVLHYAGHAFFDPQAPSKSGILCAGEEVLSGADLAVMGSLPSLVFFNACESGRARARAGSPDAGRKRAAERVVARIRESASFAEAFLRGGIANYVGTYWPVGDAAALTFAETFYQKLIAGDSLGSAVITGRQKVAKGSSRDWADYILYGDPAFVLKKRK
jgi:CHAT domain-containing protein